MLFRITVCPVLLTLLFSSPSWGQPRQSSGLAQLHRLVKDKKYTTVIKFCRSSSNKDAKVSELHRLCGLAYLRSYQVSQDPPEVVEAVYHLKLATQDRQTPPAVRIYLGEARVLASTKIKAADRGLGEMWQGIQAELKREGNPISPGALSIYGLNHYVDIIAKVVLRHSQETGYFPFFSAQLQLAWARIKNAQPASYQPKARGPVKAAKLYLADAARLASFDNGNLLTGVHWLLGRKYKRKYFANPKAGDSFTLAERHLAWGAARTRNSADGAEVSYELAELLNAFRSGSPTMAINYQSRALAYVGPILRQPHPDPKLTAKGKKLYGDILYILCYLYLKRNAPGDQQRILSCGQLALQAEFAQEIKVKILRIAALAAEKLKDKAKTLAFAHGMYEAAFRKYGLGLKKAGTSQAQTERDARILGEYIYYLHRFGEYERSQYYQSVCKRFGEKGCRADSS